MDQQRARYRVGPTCPPLTQYPDGKAEVFNPGDEILLTAEEAGSLEGLVTPLDDSQDDEGGHLEGDEGQADGEE